MLGIFVHRCAFLLRCETCKGGDINVRASVQVPYLPVQWLHSIQLVEWNRNVGSASGNGMENVGSLYHSTVMPYPRGSTLLSIAAVSNQGVLH